MPTRPVTARELADWLKANLLDGDGYRHRTAEDLALLLFDSFDIYTYAK